MIIERVSTIVYRNLIRQCWIYMKMDKPSKNPLWLANAYAVHEYVQKLKYLKNHIKDEHNEWQKINPKEA